MKKIWAKTLKEHKIMNEYLLVLDSFNYDNLYDYLKEICYELKIETPIILSKHKNQFAEFSMTQFTKEDFIDSIDFERLVVEYFEE